MYIKLISDIHVEWGAPFKIICTPQDPDTILILAGDIDNVSNFQHTVERIVRSTNFLGYILIPGNHEYYGNDFEECQKQFRELEDYFAMSDEFDNVWFSCESMKVVVYDTSFIFGPMWTDGGESEIARKVTEASLSDFRVIRNGQLLWTVDRMREEFFGFVGALEEILEYVDTPKTVLVTHHLPTYQAIAPEYKNSPSNGGFAVELSKYVKPELLEKIDVMCFGHTHSCIKKKVMIGNKKVQLLCNPRGYPKHQIIGMEPIFENNGFKQNFLFDVDSMKLRSTGKKWFTPPTEML